MSIFYPASAIHPRFHFLSLSAATRRGLLFLATASAALAQDPWTASATNLKTAFTGPIVTALIAVAVVITGMTFAFSEGQGKRQLTGLLFGGAMALGAVRFMSWIFT